MSERLKERHEDRTLPFKLHLKDNPHARHVHLAKGVLRDFAQGLYHWLSRLPMGRMLQLDVEPLVALLATMKRAPGDCSGGGQCAPPPPAPAQILQWDVAATHVLSTPLSLSSRGCSSPTPTALANRYLTSTPWVAVHVIACARSLAVAGVLEAQWKGC